MIIVNVETIKDYRNIIKWALDNDMSWANGSRFLEAQIWDYHKSETCIVIRNEKLTYSYRKLIGNNSNVDIFDISRFYKFAREYNINKLRLKYNLK